MVWLINGGTKASAAIISQARMFDSRRLTNKMATLPSYSFEKITKAFRELYVPENSHPAEGRGSVGIPNNLGIES